MAMIFGAIGEAATQFYTELLFNAMILCSKQYSRIIYKNVDPKSIILTWWMLLLLTSNSVACHKVWQ
jgi:hypothetical protein